MSCPARAWTRPDRFTYRRGRFGLEIVGLVDTSHGRRQRLGQWRIRVRTLPRIKLGKELEDPRATLGGLVEVDVQVRDPLDPQPLPELVADERHRVTQSLDGCIALGRLADDAHPHLRVTEIRCGLDLGDRDEPDPRIRHIAADDRPDLLPQQLVDALRSLAHERRPPPGPPMRALRAPRVRSRTLGCARSRAPRRLRLDRPGGASRFHDGLVGRGSTDGLRREAFDDVSLDDVVEVGQPDAALVVLGDFANVIAEPAERFDPVRRDDLAAPPDTSVTATDDASVGDE